jgi:hypothetical protein
LRDRNKIEEAIRKNEYKWIANIQTIELLIYSLTNIDTVRGNESEVWNLYGALKDLQFFRGWDRTSTIVAFSGAIIR